MSSIEIFAIAIGWTATCILSFIVGYLTRKVEEEDE